MRVRPPGRQTDHGRAGHASTPFVGRLPGTLAAVAEVLGIFGVLGFFAAVMAGLFMAGSRIRARRRGVGTAAMGPFEEMWHPAASRARLMTEAVEERVVSMPSPDDPPRSE